MHNYISNKGLISKIYKKTHITKRKQTIKKLARAKQTTPKKIHRILIGILKIFISTYYHENAKQNNNEILHTPENNKKTEKQVLGGYGENRYPHILLGGMQIGLAPNGKQ